MEGSKHFRQTRIDAEKFETENNTNASKDRVQFDINALYVPANEMRDTSGGMN
jgi:1,2-phenylacetyl-CoA epoxidase catalytic subunit